MILFKNKVNIGLFFITVFLAAGFIYMNKQAQYREFRQTRFFMDTYVEIIVCSAPDKEKVALEAINEAFKIFEELENRYDFYDSESALSSLNRQLRTDIEDAVMLQLLEDSLSMARASDGAFDPALGAYKKIYPVGEESPVPPSEEMIEKTKRNAGFEKVKLEGKKLNKPQGLLIDLGGVLKGYAVDQAYEKMKQKGIENFIINGGGNIRTAGKNMDNRFWQIGVENPRANSDVVGILALDNEAVATSGDYQRYFFYKGKRYHHIIDKKTGRPADRAIAATVVAPDALTADMASTAAFVKGPEEGMEFLKKMGLKGIIVTERSIRVTPGMEAALELLKDKP